MPLTIRFKNAAHSDAIERVVKWHSEQENSEHDTITVVGYNGQAWHTSDDKRLHLTLRFENKGGLEHLRVIHISKEQVETLKGSKEWREFHQLKNIIANIQLDNEAERERRQKLKNLLRETCKTFKKDFEHLKDEDQKKALLKVYNLEVKTLKSLYDILGEGKDEGEIKDEEDIGVEEEVETIMEELEEEDDEGFCEED
jgi:hypothetical protein